MERAKAGELCTIPEAARRTGLGLRQLRRAIQAGEVSVYQIGSWPRVRWRDVVEWIERSRLADRRNRGSAS